VPIIYAQYLYWYWYWYLFVEYLIQDISRLVAPHIKLFSLLLAAVPFRLPQLKSGTVCQWSSSHRHHCRLSTL